MATNTSCARPAVTVRAPIACSVAGAKPASRVSWSPPTVWPESIRDLVSEATWSIQCQCMGPGQLDNHVAVMALCDLISTMVVESAGAAGRKRLAAIELLHEDLDEL